MEFPTIQRIAIEETTILFFQLLFIGLIFTTIALVATKGLKLSFRLQDKRIPIALTVLSLIPIFGYLVLVFIYLFLIDYADPAEANIASVAWLFHRGYPVYPALDAAERYINNYGPFLYIIQSFFLQLFQPTFFSSKVGGCLAGCLSLLFTFLTFKQHLKLSIATVGCAVMGMCFLSMTTASGLLTSAFWLRPDSFLLTCSAIAVFSLTLNRPRLITVICAIALGVSVNLKITAFLYFIPIYVLLFQRFGKTYTLGSLIGAAGVAIAPFVFFRQVSLGNYLTWLQQVGQKGVNPSQVFKNLLWMTYIALPCAIAAFHLRNSKRAELKKWFQQRWLYLATLVGCIVTNAITGASRGALENNMLPFVPLITYIICQLLQRIPFDGVKSRKQFATSLFSLSLTFAFVISLTLTVYSTASPFVNRFFTAPGYAAIQDIYRFMRANPKRAIAIGYGGANYQLSTYRPILVFANNPYLLDSASMMEMQTSGLNNTPKKTLQQIAACQTQIWLIPKDDNPFEIHSYYPPLQKLFSNEFRRIFLTRYTKVGETRYFDTWACKR
jgi:hypothetical protein